jgi:hypothetical protein
MWLDDSSLSNLADAERQEQFGVSASCVEYATDCLKTQ